MLGEGGVLPAPAGYLAAGTTETGTVAAFGGEDIPRVTLLLDGFAEGVEHWNEQKDDDVELLGAVVNKVWFLDAVRGELDVYNMNWARYLEARATDEQRRRREREAERRAATLWEGYPAAPRAGG